MNDFSTITLAEFVDAIASDAPTPGGGTASAVAGAMGAGLSAMVTALTLTRDKYASAHGAMRRIAQEAFSARTEFLALAREDSIAYELVVAARRLPKETETQKAVRNEAIALANRRATEIPMRTAKLAARMLALLPELVEKGNPNAASDAGAAALMLEAAAQGALLNVGINLNGNPEAAFVGEMRKATTEILADTQRLRDHVLAAVRKSFAS
jgi:formiminotetrahydrofolate cyclodeaminase